jgi:hypothetical protein
MRNEPNWIFIRLCYLSVTYLGHSLLSFVKKLDLADSEDYEEAVNSCATDLFS